MMSMVYHIRHGRTDARNEIFYLGRDASANGALGVTVSVTVSVQSAQSSNGRLPPARWYLVVTSMVKLERSPPMAPEQRRV